MKVNTNRARRLTFLLSALWLLTCVFPLCAQVWITNSTTISESDTTYEQAEILVSGATLTVRGNHSFGMLRVTNQGTLSVEGGRLTAEGITLWASTGWLHTATSLRVSATISLASNSVIWCEGLNRSNKVDGV